MVGLGLGVASLAGCETSSTSQATPGAAEVAAGDAALLALDHALHGTVAEQRDVRFLEYVREQDHLDRCYREAGQSYPVPAFDDLLVGLTGELPASPTAAAAPASVSEARRAGFHVAERVLLVWESLRAANTSVARSDAWNSAARTCRASLSGAVATRNELADMWSDELARLSRDSGADAALAASYPVCMRRSGWDAHTPEEADETARAGFLSFELPGGPAVPDSTEWHRAVTHERAVAAADAACRADAHAMVAVAAGPAATDFLTRHADQLDALRRDRAVTSADAATARVAWYGDHPELPRT